MKAVTRSFVVAALSLTIAAQPVVSQQAQQKVINNSVSRDTRIAEFEKSLDSIRQELKIPALSAAIVKDQKVVWARGFGYSDVENKVPATEHTSYHLASLTKTFASTIVMKLIEDGLVKLDDPISKYGSTLEANGVVRVRHVFSHTSEGNPGERYSYNGNRFAELDKVIQKATGKSFAELLIPTILEPLGMTETGPNSPPVSKLKSPDPANAAAEGEVKAALADLYAGYVSSNIEQIERHVSPHQTSFDTDGNGYLEEFVDLAQLRKDFQAGVKIKLEAQGVEAAAYGDTALTTLITTGSVASNGGGRKLGPWRTSFVWNKNNGTWKIVHSHLSKLEGATVTEKQQQWFNAVTKNLAQPYELDKSNNIVKGKYPMHFSTSAGLMSSVLDMAKYDIAIDQNRFLKKETQQLAFTPTVSTRGEKLPYGLGWFTQEYRGMKFIWHYGYWTCNSSLILKVPERGITFIAMANTDNLSRPTDLGGGDVMSSPVGLAFLKTFVFPEMFGEALPEIDWKAPAEKLAEQLKAVTGKPYADVFKKELLVQSRVSASVGRNDDSVRIFKVYGGLYSKPLPADLSNRSPIAEIARVANEENKTVEFSLAKEQRVRVFAIGEGLNGEMYDYGWIESADTGQPVWQMKDSEATPAGGAGKNRKIDVEITLPAGKYKLHYKSDDSHSFDRWNALPPDVNFWGIALYAKEG